LNKISEYINSLLNDIVKDAKSDEL